MGDRKGRWQLVDGRRSWNSIEHESRTWNRDRDMAMDRGTSTPRTVQPIQYSPYSYVPSCTVLYSRGRHCRERHTACIHTDLFTVRSQYDLLAWETKGMVIDERVKAGYMDGGDREMGRWEWLPTG